MPVKTLSIAIDDVSDIIKEIGKDNLESFYNRVEDALQTNYLDEAIDDVLTEMKDELTEGGEDE